MSILRSKIHRGNESVVNQQISLRTAARSTEASSAGGDSGGMPAREAKTHCQTSAPEIDAQGLEALQLLESEEGLGLRGTMPLDLPGGRKERASKHAGGTEPCQSASFVQLPQDRGKCITEK